MELTSAQALKLLEDHGAGDVDDDAALELAQTLERYAGYISEEAVAHVEDDGRKAIKREDIVAAEE